MIDTQINELVAYGLKCGLVSKDDQIFVSNQLYYGHVLVKP